MFKIPLRFCGFSERKRGQKFFARNQFLTFTRDFVKIECEPPYKRLYELRDARKTQSH